MGQMAEEFSLLPPLRMSQLYLGADSNAAVQPEGGSNAAVPSSGTIRVSNLRGAVSSKTINKVTLTFQADFATLQSNTALMESFKNDVQTSVATAVGVPLSSVTIVSVTSGSVKVEIDVRYPRAGKVAADVLPKLAAIASATTATTFFGSDFLSKYSVGTTIAVVDATPPQLLTASKTLTGVTGSLATVSVADMFAAASNTGNTLRYSIASTTNPTPANVSINSSTGLVSVTGRYLNRTYAVNAVATGSNGVASAPGTLSVTEIDAPLPTLATPLGAASISNDTKTFGLSNYFATVADTLPLYYWLRANPNSNATIGAGGVLSVVGANRGATYSVSVSASNAYGKSNATPATLAVTEAVSVAAPVQVMSNQSRVYAQHPLAPMQSGTLRLEGQENSNMQYTVTSQPTSLDVYKVYDHNDGTAWKTVNGYTSGTGAFAQTQTTSISGSNYKGVLLQCELNKEVRFKSFTLTPLSSPSNEAPNTWILAGRNINEQSRIIHSQLLPLGYTGTPSNYTFTFPSEQVASTLQMVLMSTQGGTQCAIASLKHEGIVTELYPPGISILNGSSTILSGQSNTQANGTYVCSISPNDWTSAANAPYGIWGANGFASLGVFSPSTKAYTGATTTFYDNGESVKGAWFQMKVPNAFYLSHYAFTDTFTTNATPGAWMMLGSSDAGTSWNQLDVRSNQVMKYAYDTIRCVLPTLPTMAYDTYRMVITSGATTMTSSYILVAKMTLNGC